MNNIEKTIINNIDSNSDARIMIKDVSDFENYSTLTTNPLLMISELIDNSISSFSKTLNTNKEINITIDKVDGTFVIRDNAYGMDERTLDNAINVGNKHNIKKDSDMNIYGIGMKQSAFYLARKLEIFTRFREDYQLLNLEIDLDYLEKHKKGQIEYHIKDLSKTNDNIKYHFGTTIKLSKIRKGKFKYGSIEAFNYLISCLGWRYKNFLKDISINVEFIYSKEKGIKPYFAKVKPLFPKFENLNYWNKKIHDINDYNQKLNNNFGSLNQTKEGNDFKEKLFKNQDLKWSIEVPFKDDLGITRIIKGQIGVLLYRFAESKKGHKSYKKYKGLTIFQNKRAIKCGPNDKNNFYRNLDIS